MKQYTLVFPFDKTGEHTLVRTMPDGKNKGLLNGLGGQITLQSVYTKDQMAKFFDEAASNELASVHVMTVTFPEGCTPKSEDQPIKLDIYGKVYEQLKFGDFPKANEIKHMHTYDAIVESAETEVDEYASPGSRKYVPGYHYFITEAYAALKHAAEKKGNKTYEFK